MSQSKPDLTEGGKKPELREERRGMPTSIEAEKFATQRRVTYTLLLMLFVLSAWVMYQNNQAERSTIIQTIINLVMLAVGYWFGMSKQGQDQAQSLSRLAEAAPGAALAASSAFANAVAGSGQGGPSTNVPAWEKNKLYEVDQPVTSPNGQVHVCKVQHTSSDWVMDLGSGKWAPKS